jgi:DNA-binding transcriptional MocR family regulator
MFNDFAALDAAKAKLDALRPLPPALVRNLHEDLVLRWTVLKNIFVGPGHWFEQDRRYMRVGFGWPTSSELEEGLENISSALNAVYTL